MSIFDFFDTLPQVHPPLLLGRMFSTATYSSLPLNISSSSTHYTVRTDLPGIPQNKISVDIDEDGILTIQAERNPKDEKEKTKDGVENEIIKETWVTQGKLQRCIKFPKDQIDVDGVKAELNNGELIVKVPKKKTQEEKEKKRNIKIIKGKL
ncbi:HSP20-like chaperone [Glomus cerebriforme]|uniref:HSP20-like chaperone n=1 Tax=Glomus cerebriforme TaxID=658196 RepID=A0A397SSV3_9GLOM|nr:HSP20-like chaperone [Glomus cerebriforme]